MVFAGACMVFNEKYKRPIYEKTGFYYLPVDL
jgi:hypothetical protein